MSREVLLKRIEVENDRFKVGVSLIVILSSGLVGLFLKGVDTLTEIVLAVGGVLLEGIFMLYTLRTYIKVERLIAILEEKE